MYFWTLLFSFRGNSIKKDPSAAPKIKISRPRPESLTFDLDDHDRIEDSRRGVLPDEITQELEALSHEDRYDRQSRIAKLEKLRRGEEELDDEEDVKDEDQEQTVGKKVTLPESTESSVEGIYISGVRQSHPFKVIEPEPDRRSICSETRSGHGRISVSKHSLPSQDPGSRGDSVSRFSDVSRSWPRIVSLCFPFF